MNVIALLIGLGLLATGLYRLWNEQQAAAPLPPPDPSPPPKTPRAKPPAATSTAKPRPEPSDLPPAPKVPPAGDAASTAKLAAASTSLFDESDDEDITIITLNPVEGSRKPVEAATIEEPKAIAAPAKSAQEFVMPPAFDGEDEEEYERSAQPSAVPIVYDDDAREDEPTRNAPWILVSAAAQTDRGRKRRRNEDSYLALEQHHVFVVADGMGGHAGGDVASKMAVDIIGGAFDKSDFQGDPYPDVPKRGGELALAIQMANKAIYEHARANAAFQGMGTTVVSARFSPNKQRVYFGHVGDSRCYRFRAGQLTQITTDHTMASEGITGPLASHLNRAVGILPGVKVDLIIARPLPDDTYLLCSDGLSKMMPDDRIREILASQPDAEKAVAQLVEEANTLGGRDNITVVVVQVKDAAGVAQFIRGKAASAGSGAGGEASA